MSSGSVMAGTNNITAELIALKNRVELLLAARGEGEIDTDAIYAQIDAAVQDAIDQVLAQIAGLESGVLSSRLDMESLIRDVQSLYGDRKFFFEMFSEFFTVADFVDVAVTGSGVMSGASVIPVANSSFLTVGKEYLIEGSGNREIITIESVPDSTSVEIAVPLISSYNNTAKVLLTAFDFSPATGATATNKQTYYSGTLNLGDDSEDKGLNIRRTDNDAVISVYFKDADNTSWTAATLSGSDTSVGETGYRDDQYTFGASGDFELKAVVTHGASAQDVTLKYFVGINDAGVMAATIDQKIEDAQADADFTAFFYATM